MSRLDDLTTLRDGLKARMAVSTSDQNYAVMGKLLADVVKQLDELGEGSAGERERTGLSEFEKRLAERTGSARSSRTKSG